MLMVLGVDGQTDGQSRIQTRRSEKTLGQVALILRLYCKQEGKDVYTVSQILGSNIFSDKIFGLYYNFYEVQFFLVFNRNDSLLTNNYSIHISISKCFFHTLHIHIEIDHKAVSHHSRTKIIDTSVCHSYSAATLHRCSTE